MKRLALMIACVMCYVCACLSVYAQDSVAVSLSIDDGGKIRPTNVRVQFEVEGKAQIDYLKINSAGKYAATKLGYDENAVFKEVADLKAGGFQFLKMTLKDLGSTNWNQMMLSLNEEYPNRKVIIGNYIAGAEDLGDGWFRITIPLKDLQPVAPISHMVFPHAFNANIGVRDITFTGDKEPLQWFGSEKFDNARKDNQPAQSELIFRNEGMIVDEMKLRVLNTGNEFVQLSMPYKLFHPGVLQGENKFVAVVLDKSGNTYSSDTLSFQVPAGLSYKVTPVSCNGGSDGSIDLTINGGTPPYTFAWTNGATTEDITGLSASLYTVEVIDSLGKTATTTIEVQQSNDISADMSSDHCYEDRAFLNVYGGNAPYQYSVDGASFESLGTVDEEDVWQLSASNASDREGYFSRRTALKVDQGDNVYLAGEHDGLIEFGSGSVGSLGRRGNFLVKVNAEGTFSWGIYSEDNEPHEYYRSRTADMTVDDDGNSTLIIEVKRNYIILEPADINLPKGAYLIHFDTHGDLQWIKEYEASLSNVRVDATGNIYVIGRQLYTTNTGNGLSDLFMSKYNQFGELLWKKEISGMDGETNEYMFIDKAGDIYLTGSFSVEINFGGLKLQSQGRKDAYVAKLNSEGEPLWAKAGGCSNNDDAGYTVMEDGNGNVFVTITFDGSDGKFGDLYGFESEQVLFMMDAQDGSILWGRPYAHAGFLNPEETFDLVFIDNSIYMTTEAFTLIFREGENFKPGVYDDIFLLEFDYSGNLHSLRGLGSFEYDYHNDERIAITRDNHLVVSNSKGGFAIIKHGPPMRQSIPISPENQYITVSDVNGCSFILNDLTFKNLPPAPPTICYITSGNNGNKLFFTSWEQDEPIVAYNIHRETFATGEYEMIGSAGESEFLDSTSNTTERSYQYVVTAIDGCGNESDFSDPHRTMHLTVNEGNLGQINLIWDGYHGIDYSSFKIYRGSSPADMELLTSVPSYLYTYTDMDPSPLTLYYQIRVENDRSCSEGESSDTQGRLTEGGTSREITSNVAANFGEAGNLTFYPNPAQDRISVTFSPDGDQYQMQVIDLSGRIVKQIDGIFDKAVIERGNLPAGIYNVVLSKSSGKRLHGRVVFR